MCVCCSVWGCVRDCEVWDWDRGHECDATRPDHEVHHPRGHGRHPRHLRPRGRRPHLGKPRLQELLHVLVSTQQYTTCIITEQTRRSFTTNYAVSVRGSCSLSAKYTLVRNDVFWSFMYKNWLLCTKTFFLPHLS